MERITLPLRREQLENLIHLERKIMGNRSRGSKKQRITKNSLIRIYVDLMLSVTINTREISDEKELGKRYKQALKGQGKGD